MTDDSIGKTRLLQMLVLVFVVFAASSYVFARAQNLWVDETTQLSGITLAPGPLLAWLSGHLDPSFGVPSDRMPPFSYFVDMIGWHIWGGNEFAFRLYHVLITAGGLLVLMVALARRLSLRAALIAGLLLALSPKLIATAVEIRAYPILLTLSCAQLALVILGDVAAKPKRLALFLLLGLLSGYTHFFGLIATSAYTAAVFIDTRDRQGVVRIVLGYALLLLLWLGLAPFIFGASANSGTEQTGGLSLSEIASFLAQTLASSAIMVQPALAALYFAGAGVLILVSGQGLAHVIVRKGFEARHSPMLGVAAALIIGVCGTLLARMLVTSFDPLAPRYNIWMLPPLMALIAVAADNAFGLRGKLARITQIGGLALLAIGAIWGQAFFLSRAELFIHGPSRALETMLAQSKGPVAIVYLGDTWSWGYFPLYYSHGDAVPQWMLSPDGRSVARLSLRDGASGKPQSLSVLGDQAALLVSHIELKDYKDLREISDGKKIVNIGDIAPSLTQIGWRAGERVYQPGNFAFTGQMYERSRSVSTPDDKALAPYAKDRSE